jgi:phage replication O-like protein O
MANPQTENGHTDIANELLEAIIQISLSDYEHRVYWAIIRRTYGWKKKMDWINNFQISEATGILPCHISRTLKKLLEKNIVLKDGKQFGINKDYDTWNVKLPNQVIKADKEMLPKEVTNTDTENLPEWVEPNFENIPKQVTENTQTGNFLLPKQVNTKYIYKETIQNKVVLEILNHWNNKNIIVHSMTKKIEKQIKATLKIYTKEKILLAIDHYSITLKDESYQTVAYKWDIIAFLKQGNALPLFLDDGIRWINYNSPASKGNGKQKISTGKKLERL